MINAKYSKAETDVMTRFRIEPPHSKVTLLTAAETFPIRVEMVEGAIRVVVSDAAGRAVQQEKLDVEGAQVPPQHIWNFAGARITAERLGEGYAEFLVTVASEKVTR